MTKLTSIKAVTFDVDDTIWDFDAAMRRCLMKALDELRLHDADAAGQLDIDTLAELRDIAHEELRGKVTDLSEIRRESFKRALRYVGRPNDELGDHLFEVYVRHRSQATKLFSDVRPALEALKPGYTLGIISNGNTYPEHFGLEDLIDFSVYGQDHCGLEKPDPRIFHIAVEQAGCTAAEIVHVGDSLENDVDGAKAAGLHAVWLNRNGAAQDRPGRRGAGDRGAG